MTKNKKDFFELHLELEAILLEIRGLKTLTKEINYTLLEPVKYGVGGIFKETKEVILKAPLGKHIDLMDKAMSATGAGIPEVLDLVGSGDLMLTKEEKIGINVTEFNDLDIRVLNDLTSTYMKVFFS
jgi:hypothetical protein